MRFRGASAFLTNMGAAPVCLRQKNKRIIFVLQENIQKQRMKKYISAPTPQRAQDRQCLATGPPALTPPQTEGHLLDLKKKATPVRPTEEHERNVEPSAKTLLVLFLAFQKECFW